MSETFKVGERAILQNDPSFTVDPFIKRINGEEIEIIGELRLRHLGDGPFYGYMVWHPLTEEFFCAPHELRRPKPPTTGEYMIQAMFDAPSQPQPVPEAA